jgi:hypothetical protein
MPVENNLHRTSSTQIYSLLFVSYINAQRRLQLSPASRTKPWLSRHSRVRMHVALDSLLPSSNMSCAFFPYLFDEAPRTLPIRQRVRSLFRSFWDVICPKKTISGRVQPCTSSFIQHPTIPLPRERCRRLRGITTCSSEIQKNFALLDFNPPRV